MLIVSAERGLHAVTLGCPDARGSARIRAIAFGEFNDHVLLVVDQVLDPFYYFGVGFYCRDSDFCVVVHIYSIAPFR